MAVTRRALLDEESSRGAHCTHLTLAILGSGPASATPTAAEATPTAPPATVTVRPGQASVTAEYFATDGRLLSKATYGPETAGQSLGSSTDPLAASGTDGTSSASGCVRVTVNNEQETTLGFTAYWFHSWTRWCWTRSTQVVYDVSSGWSISDVDGTYYWRGIVNQELAFYDYSTNDGHPRSAYKNYRQGNFETCVLKYGCIGNRYPTNTLRSYYNGTWAWSTN